jgi:hypothetical protein
MQEELMVEMLKLDNFDGMIVNSRITIVDENTKTHIIKNYLSV